MKHSKKRKGYTWIYAPDHKYSKPKKKGYILQHRYIVENFIGRGLKSEEVIHHLNFKKSDNRISNLMVFSNNNEHIKWHVKEKQFGLNTNMRKIIKQRWKDLKDSDSKMSNGKRVQENINP